jgi:hypothetical protein
MNREEIKIGAIIKANFDGCLSRIVDMKDNIVIYDCFSYKCIFRESGLFQDSVETIMKEFKLSTIN